MSKLFYIALKLTSPVLGNERNKTTTRLLPDIGPGQYDSEVAQWNWLLKNAEEVLRIEGLASGISVDTYLSAVKTDTYQRTYRSGTGKDCTESFECFPAGAYVAIRMTTLVPEKENQPEITEEQLHRALVFIGRMIGFSYFGRKLGYGRFTVESIKETNKYDDTTMLSTDPGNPDGSSSFGTTPFAGLIKTVTIPAQTVQSAGGDTKDPH